MKSLAPKAIELAINLTDRGYKKVNLMFKL